MPEGWGRCLTGHEKPKGVKPDDSPMVVSLAPLSNQEEEDMAEYDNASLGGVIVRDSGERDRSFEAALISSGDDASRDVADAGRDLTMSGDDASRDLTSALADAGRDVDIMSAVREEGGNSRATTLDARGHVTDAINEVGRQGLENTLREGAAGRQVTLEQSKDNVERILEQGSMGRETTLKATADLMREHCETQKLVIKEACETREAVRDEGERTRELIRDEANAALLRELTASQNANSLLQLRIDILSGGGPGPLSR